MEEQEIVEAKEDLSKLENNYKELYDYVFENKFDKEELQKCIDLIKQHSRNYAKRPS